ncbi:MAG TPA: signal recognition particle protein [Methylomusa anaerophila]|uniref:Signal recognition particle protein n=1 Tax=Methylomusa anaerophila TaxID=1930071 RepID=A0A348AQ72_9FIRM|nr:signal recognition particle protein [Methylomusa anaerophila]BBB93220.1 signal recognition particle protein [Methylomusa anaerophila]HML86948.1 signal recognition particle protein [Methylomusa anaerophila]
MVFESLADKLQQTFKKLRGRGKLSEGDVADALKEVRLALLEADVNFKVVKDLIAKIKERAIGQEVLESLTPAQHVIKIVNEELANLMGGTQSRIVIASKPPTVVMLVGLQGAGKTTTAGKLANHLKRQGKRPLLVAGDIYRPAAIKQLQVLGEQLDIPVFTLGDKERPVDIAKKAVEQALSMARDIIIIDTAGRLHINEELMQELKSIKQTVRPHEILLVVDAMTGQDAVTVAEAFNNDLGIDGIILTKLDGDARGGAALSVKAVTGKPIKFAGMGEKLDALEPFHPDRMASRILGMGDVLSLIEKAESNLSLEKAQELQKKLRKEEFTLNDFLDQIEQVRKLGPLDQILGMLPGMGKIKQLQGMDFDEKEIKHIIAIIRSMTAKERRDPSIINGSRRKRIALGSGTRVQDVNRLLKQFSEAKKMMKRLQEMQKSGKKGGGFKLPFMR